MIGLFPSAPRAGALLAATTAMTMAVMLAGCGGEPTSAATKASPEAGRRNREMEDFMKANKQAAPPAKVRDHP